jgi:CBS domain containing-hemolysin-like protein
VNNQTLIIILVVLIIFSGLFSATETAFSSLNPAKLKYMIENGNKRALKTLQRYERFEKLLVTILIGNNIVNLLSASLATILFINFFNDEDLGVTLSTIVMTTVVLIFGEITPKSIAKEIPEGFAIAVTPFLSLVNIIIYPLVLLFYGIQVLMRKFFNIKKSSITENELITYIQEIEKEGTINANERDLIQKVLDFDAMKVLDILTPRVDIVACDITESIENIQDLFESTGHSRIPIYDKDLDHIVGIIHYKDFMYFVLPKKKSLKTMMKDPIFITEYMRVVDLMHMLKTKKEHIAIVKDEYGGTEGLVSLEDILEEIVGEIWDEHDQIKKEIQHLDDGSYLIKGSAYMDIVSETLSFEYDEEAQTLNGFILENMKKIPHVNDVFQYLDFQITITKATRKKVLEAHIKKGDTS